MGVEPLPDNSHLSTSKRRRLFYRVCRNLISLFNPTLTQIAIYGDNLLISMELPEHTVVLSVPDLEQDIVNAQSWIKLNSAPDEANWVEFSKKTN